MSCQQTMGEDFDKFVAASTMKQVLAHFRRMKLKPAIIQEFYPHLKSMVRTWKAQAIFKKLDIKYSAKVYNTGRVCPHNKMLIIGAGPCGLRSAIEAQLLGAKVVVVEKRDRFSRNNVLHLWPFVIEDLKAIGAKKFLGNFCAGSINHISIRQLQLILLKVCLILGVEVHENVAFEGIQEPNPSDDNGWRATLSPAAHPVSNFEFDCLIGADGKRNTLSGFKRKEFRGKLAIAITANFINKHTTAEAKVPEISGISFIFNQPFFIGLKNKLKIDLENIVYYKDETHYFVMTSKKHSLLERNVLLEDHPDTQKLLARENINYNALKKYALDAAAYATNDGLENLEFAVNHYGDADVSVFDFTSMFTAENASRFVERCGYPLLTCLVGDSLLEPFWPTGSGCARGFLSSLDACWAMRLLATGVHPLHVLAERESIYRLLPQATPMNLNTDISKYTVDPTTRYVALNKNKVSLHQVMHLFETDENFDILSISDSTSKITLRKGQKARSLVAASMLYDWVAKEINREIFDLDESFRDGTIITNILQNYRPEMFGADTDTQCTGVNESESTERHRVAADILKKLGVNPFMSATEMTELEEKHYIQMLEYMSKIYYLFKGEIPYTFYNESGSNEPQDALAVPENREGKRLSSNKRKRRSKRESVESSHVNEARKRPQLSHEALIKWINSEIAPQEVDNLTNDLRDGTIICRIVQKYKPHLFNAKEFDPKEDIENNEVVLKILHDLGVPPLLHALEMTLLSGYHNQKMVAYLSSIFYLFRDEIQVSEELKNLIEAAPIKDDQHVTSPEKIKKRKSSGVMKCTNADHRASPNNQEELNAKAANKKPKDLMRAVGQITETDWQLKQLEKKIHDNKFGAPLQVDKEKVPKWDKTQFLERQSKITDSDKLDDKFLQIDSSLKQLDLKLKEGSALETGERGKNKVSLLAGQFNKAKDGEEQNVQFLEQFYKLKEGNDIGNMSTQADTSQNIKHVQPFHHHVNKVETCYVCGGRVYLMEKINAEGLVLHKKCFKCVHCQAPLKIGSYMIDKMGKFGNSIFCPNHFGQKTLKPYFKPSKKSRSPKPKNLIHEIPEIMEPDRQIVEKGDTPERIEIISRSDTDDQLCEIDEDEWTDRNFGSFSVDNEKSESEDDSSTSSGEFDSADSDTSDSGGSLDTYSSASYEYSTAGEEAGECSWKSEGRALELRRREVALGVAPSQTPSDSELASECTSKHSEAENATEVSTDSEFGPLIETPPPPLAPPIVNYSERYQRSTIKGIELKKKYLLGPHEGTMLQKSNSASELNSRFREFHSNISECQKLLNPAAEISPSMQAFLDNSSKRNTSGLLSPIPRVEIMKPCGEVIPGTVDNDKSFNDNSNVALFGEYLKSRMKTKPIKPSQSSFYEDQEEEHRENNLTQSCVGLDESLIDSNVPLFDGYVETEQKVKSYNISGFISRSSLELYENDEEIPLTPLYIENIPSQSSSGTDNNITALNMDVRQSDCNIKPKNIVNALETSRKLEELTKQKQKEIKAIHELVMDKMSKRTDKRRPRCSNFKNASKDSSKLSENINSNLIPSNNTSACEDKIRDYTFSLPDIHQAVLNREQAEQPNKSNFSERQQMLSELDSLELPNIIQPSGIVPGFRQLSLSDFSGKLVQHVESLRKSGSFCKSEPNLFMTSKTHKDNERRKSIMKTVSDFFSRKRDPVTRTNDISPITDKNSKIHYGHKIRNKSKVNTAADGSPYKSIDSDLEAAPPIPPLPGDYAIAATSSKSRISAEKPYRERIRFLRTKLKDLLNGEEENEVAETSIMEEIIALRNLIRLGEKSKEDDSC